MMINRSIILTMILLLLASASGQAEIKPSPEQDSTANKVILVQSTNDRVVVDIHVNRYTLTDHVVNGIQFQSIDADGLSQSEESGKPQLPMASFSLGVPIDSTITLGYVVASTEFLSGQYHLLPAPQPALMEEDFVPVGEVYIPDLAIYRSKEIFPSQVVRIVEDGFIRDQRIIRVEVSPFQYLPASGSLVLHSSVRVTININQPTQISHNQLARHFSTGQETNNPFDNVLKNLLLNYQQAKEWRAWPKIDRLDHTTSEGSRYKIALDQDGIYRLTYSDLVNAGMDVAQVDPRMFHITNQGRDVAIYVKGEEDGIFGVEDYIQFYGEKFNGDYLASLHASEADGWLTYTRQFSDGTLGSWHPQFTAEMLEKYTDENVYWLKIDTSGSPPRMETVEGTPGSATVPKSYTAIVHEEKDWRHWEYHFVTEDTWFWDWVQDSNEHVYTTTLSSIAPDPFTATVRGELVAFTYNNFSSPDHHTVVKLNSQPTPINDAYWEGRSLYSFISQVPSSDLVEGINQLIFQVPADSVSAPSIFFNWYEIEYQRSFMAIENRLHFPGELPGTWRYQIDGFSSEQVEVFNITNPLMPKRIINVEMIQTGSGYRADFQVSHDIAEQFYLAQETAYLKPESLSLYTPPNLKAITNQADYLIITHPNFMAEAQRLADYRESQGLSSMVVSILDIYNEFNEGIYHPIAIKNFLRYALSTWETPAPTYVVLVGDGHFNDKFVSPERYGSLPIYLPANLGWVDPWQGEVDSSNLLVTLVGDDILPDMIIGRMPVNSPEELAAIIDKTISFENAPLAEWQLRNLFVADNTPDEVGDFVALSEELISSYWRAGFLIERVYLDTFTDTGTCGAPIVGGPSCPAANHAITETMSTAGAQIVTYIGHGHVVRWANEQIMLIRETEPYYNDVSTINNADMLSVVLDMTCFTGYWFFPTYPYLPSLAETFLRTENRGAVATFSSTGRGVATGHDVLSKGFFQTIYGDGYWDIGTATLGAKLGIYNAGVYSDLINTYMIFGDPALHLHSPYNFTLSPEQDSKFDIAGSTVNYTLVLTNTSALTDTFEINLAGNYWETALSSMLISLLPGEKTNIDITVTIPEEIIDGSMDSVLVEVVSQGDRNKSVSATLQTIGYSIPDERIFIPFIVK